ncbi:hypothetical protein F4805DRAFT_423788 [Annulohypoxylon moriforme]|nr:hypothetical protein F4805DRAFT_423788 [Annulohypoxylon moriforme]
MMNLSQELTLAAQYGNMPFDVFLIERWDRTADVAQDKQQWDKLARRYLALKPREREPYHKEASRRWQQQQRHHITSNPSATLKAETEAAAADDIIITRILPSMQTIQERNFYARRLTQTSHEPALVRTYYGTIDGENRDEAYKAMAQNFLLEACVDENGVWDDRTLYDVGDNWQNVVLRMPGLGDEEATLGREDEYYDGDGVLDRDPPGADERDKLEVWLRKKKLATRLYVVDREAMEKGMVKVFYLDPHGNVAWSHKFRTEAMLEYTGAWHGMNWADINWCFSETGEDGSELLF